MGPEREVGRGAGTLDQLGEAGGGAPARKKRAEHRKTITVPFAVIVETVGSDHRRPFGLGSFATVGRSAAADYVRTSRKNAGMQLIIKAHLDQSGS
jgi:hypothetical protein